MAADSVVLTAIPHHWRTGSTSFSAVCVAAISRFTLATLIEGSVSVYRRLADTHHV